MMYAVCLLIGFNLGMAFSKWANGPDAYATGERWGKAAREFMGLPKLQEKE